MTDIERVILLAATMRFQLEVLQRRVLTKPGHQNITPLELVEKLRHDLDQIEQELRVHNV